jgi:hypothetical protein
MRHDPEVHGMSARSLDHELVGTYQWQVTNPAPVAFNRLNHELRVGTNRAPVISTLTLYLVLSSG